MTGSLCPCCKKEVAATARAALELLVDSAATKEERSVAYEELSETVAWFQPQHCRDAGRNSIGSDQREGISRAADPMDGRS